MYEHNRNLARFATEDGLAERITIIKPDQQYNLLTDFKPTWPLKDAITGVILSSTHGGFDTLSISTMAEFEKETRNYDVVSDDFIDNIRHADFGLRAKKVKSRSKLGALIIEDNIYDDQNGLLVPVHSGLGWILSSVLDHYYDDGKQVTTVQRLIDSHALVLNALSYSILGVDFEQTIEEDKLNKKGLFFFRGPVPQIDDLLDNDKNKAEVPSESFLEFVGIDSVISRLNDIVTIANTNQRDLEDAGIDPVQTILLSGPTGTGKTHLAKAFANAINARLIEKELDDLSSSHIGEWSENFGQVFDEALDSKQRIVIFFDEADGQLQSGNRIVDANIMAVLKKKLEKIKSKDPKVFVIFATNDESVFPPELRSKKRIQETIRIPRPNEQARTSIFRRMIIGSLLAEIKLSDFDNTQEKLIKTNNLLGANYDYELLSKMTEDFTAGDIREVVQITKRYRLAEKGIEHAKLPPLQNEIIRAINEIKQTREA